VAGKLPNLQKLFLTACRSITDELVRGLAAECKGLRQFDILGTPITCHALGLLLASCHKLEFLDVSFCKHISAQDVDQFRADYPNVNIKRSY
jgi:F-box/leucine-rich repeat protein 4